MGGNWLGGTETQRAVFCAPHKKTVISCVTLLFLLFTRFSVCYRPCLHRHFRFRCFCVSFGVGKVRM